MTSIKSISNPRTSLRPPLGNRSSPNAPMVDASNVPKTIINHIRQRDRETATVEEQEEAINQQRRSLANAYELIDGWKKTYLADNSTNVEKGNDQMKAREDEMISDTRNQSEIIKNQRNQQKPKKSPEIFRNR